MDTIRSYILRIVAAALLCGICQSFFSSKNAAGAIVRMVTGLLLAITVLSPVVDLRIGDLTGYLSGLQTYTDSIVEDGEEVGQRERAGIISEQCETYILDKAASLGLTLQVDVQLADDDFLRPKSITLKGSVSPYAKSILEEYIADSLGIPKDKQLWSIN